jgi:hypothetical protein
LTLFPVLDRDNWVNALNKEAWEKLFNNPWGSTYPSRQTQMKIINAKEEFGAPAFDHLRLHSEASRLDDPDLASILVPWNTSMN